MKKIALTSAAIFALPLFAFAQSLAPFTRLVQEAGSIIQLLIPTMIALAVVAFFWGLVQFIFKTAGAKGVSAGKNLMIGAVVALFIMVSLWGIINFLGTIVGIQQTNNALQAPRVQQ